MPALQEALRRGRGSEQLPWQVRRLAFATTCMRRVYQLPPMRCINLCLLEHHNFACPLRRRRRNVACYSTGLRAEAPSRPVGGCEWGQRGQMRRPRRAKRRPNMDAADGHRSRP
mmetsp:Transcript_31129/g.90815  ORF Transcript_31129/g.90815 Transcript_31129/m.90815 type:complete len:114 (+) Transcript_31129:91-432(+)